MEAVLTLIAANNKRFDQKKINQIRTTLDHHHAYTESYIWQEEGIACDIYFRGMEIEQAYTALRNHAEDNHLDIIIQPNTPFRHKKLLICDMDSTMIEQECIDEIAACLGIKEQVAAITRQAMNGTLDFKKALTERVKLLAGVSVKQLQQIYEKHITCTPQAALLVKTMRQSGAHCLLVSGGFTFFSQKVAQALGFHESKANTLEIKDGYLTGRVAEPILDKDSKLDILEQEKKRLALHRQEILAIGDGANDIPMLQAAGLGVAYRAHAIVKQQIPAQLNHNYLGALLYVQGMKIPLQEDNNGKQEVI